MMFAEKNAMARGAAEARGRGFARAIEVLLAEDQVHGTLATLWKLAVEAPPT
jgi:hypothetical protein